MYINPFVAGILVTLMTEIVIVLAAAIIANAKKRK